MSLRIIAFVDHEIGYRLLEKILTLSSKNKLSLAAVVTTTENGETWWPGVEALCKEADIPLFRYESSLNEILNIKNIDWYLLISWKHLVPSHIIKNPILGVVNLHYSLLPKHRGVYPSNWAIINGDKTTGITYHLVNDKIDAGKTITQGKAIIHPSDTARTLQLRLDDLAFELFDEMICTLPELDLNKEALQNPDFIKQGSYNSRSDFNKVCEIDLNHHYRGEDLINLLRGLTFFPDSRNAFFIDPETGRKIYVSINMNPKE